MAPEAAGRGVGTGLLDALVERSEARNVWTPQAGVFPENMASVALHGGLAFEVVGTRGRLGQTSFGPLKARWPDVLLLEAQCPRWYRIALSARREPS